MNFSKEEIALCKKIAEKYRKEIKYGDWVECNNEQFIFVSEYKKLAVVYSEDGYDLSHRMLTGNITPLWQISDCLEFLKSKSFYGGLEDVGNYYEASYKKTIIGKNDEDLSILVGSGIAKTPLEAYLKAVLAIVEEL